MTEIIRDQVCACCEVPCAAFYRLDDKEGDPILDEQGFIQYLCCECAA